MARRVLRVLRLARAPILTQLWIEEALLYRTEDNWLLLNDGPGYEGPAVVLGISGRPELMCDLGRVRRDGIPLIRRFSGGGTVVVDKGTIFSSIIMGTKALPHVKPYPRDIMAWSEGVYGPAFSSLVGPGGGKSNPGNGGEAGGLAMGLRENDYVFGNLKFGGNAQAIAKDRWIHHTSFLWEFDTKVMSYLQMPAKRPEYRGDRDHENFLVPLSRYIRDRESVAPSFIEAFAIHFDVEICGERELENIIGALGGMREWASECRTKCVGESGKEVAPYLIPSLPGVIR